MSPPHPVSRHRRCFIGSHNDKPSLGICRTNHPTVSGRKVELDEVIVPTLNLEGSSSEKSVHVMPTPIGEEANDKDHETSDQVAKEPRRSKRARSTPEWYDSPVMEVMLLDQDEPTNYEEAMMSPDYDKWLEAMKSEIGSMYENKV